MNEYNGMKVGDLVTSYWSGFFTLIEIIPRYQTNTFPYYTQEYQEGLEPYSPLFVLKQKYRKSGEPINSKVEYKCDALVCKPAKDLISKELMLLKKASDSLKKLLDTL